MIIGVPGSGKHEIIARFILIAKKYNYKVLLMGLNNQSLDNVFLRLLEIEKDHKIEEADKVKFVRVSNNASQINKKLRKYTNNCQRFESLEHLRSYIMDIDCFSATTMSVFN